MNRRPLRFFAAACAALVLWVTVGPAPWTTSGNEVAGGILNPDAWIAPVTWTTGYLGEMVFNVALFVPVGLFAALLIPRRRWPLAMLTGLAFTTVIEVVQLPLADRISDPRDLVMNTGGAVLGVALVIAARLVRRAGAVAAEFERADAAAAGLSGRRVDEASVASDVASEGELALVGADADDHGNAAADSRVERAA